MDNSSRCRFCLTKINIQKVTTIEEVEYNGISIEDYSKFLQIDHNFILSDAVCKNCFDKLREIEQYRKQCQAAHEKLLNEIKKLESHDYEQNIFNSSIKSEDIATSIKNESNDENITRLLKNSNVQQCFFCHKTFNGKRKFSAHRKTCSIKQAKCTVVGCNKQFVTKSGFNAHITHIHGLPKISKYICSLCNKSFQINFTDFQKHHNNCFNKNGYKQQNIQCDICKIIFDNFDDYTAHKIQHDTKNLVQITDLSGIKSYRKQEKNNFICDLCGKVFGNSRNIRKHKQNVHLVDFDGLLFCCDLCPVKKPTKRLLYKHMKSVHIIKLTSCEICGKVYRTKELWQKHSLTHNNSKKSHMCPYCPNRSGFLCKSALQKHLRRSHMEFRT